MLKKLILLLTFINALKTSEGQTSRLNYPFTFSKKRSNEAAFNKGVYVLAEKNRANLAFVLQDIDKADYVLVDSNLKKISNFSLSAKETIFNYEASNLNQLVYAGATSLNNVFNFVYKNKRYKLMGSKEYNSFKVEVVDFVSKTVKQKNLVDIPKTENLISSFSAYNKFYIVTAKDDAYSIKLYILSGDGSFTEKEILFPVLNEKKQKLSACLKNVATISDGEISDLEDATKDSKLFTSKEKLTFLTREEGIFYITTINLENFSVSLTKIDKLNEEGPIKSKFDINVFKIDNKLFAIKLGPEKINLYVFDESGKFINNLEITETNFLTTINGNCITEERKGKKSKSEAVDNFNNTLKELKKGELGITVETTSSGQFLITIGTYKSIYVDAGPRNKGSTAVGYGSATSPSTQATSTTYYYSYYVPGSSRFVSKPNYYNITSFKLLIDTTLFRPLKNKTIESVSQQIINFISDSEELSMTSQFSFGKNQYYGFYDREGEEYIITRIPVKRN